MSASQSERDRDPLDTMGAAIRQFLEDLGSELKNIELREVSYDIFVSYDSRDRELARTLQTALESKGLKCFRDEKSIGAGEYFSEAIIDGINRSRLILVVVSPNAMSRPWVNREIGMALAQKRKIVPALKGVGKDRLDEPLARNQARVIDTHEQQNSLVTELASSLLRTK